MIISKDDVGVSIDEQEGRIIYDEVDNVVRIINNGDSTEIDKAKEKLVKAAQRMILVLRKECAEHPDKWPPE